MRLRKMVAFERFLARLVAYQPGVWLLKGGLVLQWRLGNQARTTKDLDMLLTAPIQDIHGALVQAALLELGDWFRFLAQQPTEPDAHNLVGGLRFLVRALLDGRPFETFHVDIGWGDPVVEPAEELVAPPLLEFAEIRPTIVPCYPVTQHVAVKLHAYTRPRMSGASSRVKDLVDILLIGRMRTMDGAMLRKALRATFEARGTHPLPLALPDPPASWATSFRKLAREVGMESEVLGDATALARRFLEPILRGRAQGMWDPHTWRWP